MYIYTYIYCIYVLLFSILLMTKTLTINVFFIFSKEFLLPALSLLSFSCPHSAWNYEMETSRKEQFMSLKFTLPQSLVIIILLVPTAVNLSLPKFQV